MVKEKKEEEINDPQTEVLEQEPIVEQSSEESREAWVQRATLDVVAASIAFKTTVNELLNDIADIKNKITK